MAKPFEAHLSHTASPARGGISFVNWVRVAFGNRYRDDYPTCVEAYATLRIGGGAEHPDTITARLGIQPSSMRVKGHAGRWDGQEWRGLDDGPLASRSMWCLSSKGLIESRDSMRHIDYLLEAIDGKDDLLASLVREGWEIDVSVFWVSNGGGGPMISPQTMGRLSQLNLEIGFDVYFNDLD